MKTRDKSFQLKKFPSGVVLGQTQQAFTLVELMVAVSVLSLMILFLFSVFNLASQAWQASEKKVDAFREARAALFMMRRDLSGLKMQTNLPFLANSAGLLIDGQQPSSNNAFFISAQTASIQDGAKGDLCAVGYYMAWSTNNYQPTAAAAVNEGVSRSYNLFRYFRNSNDTFGYMTNFWNTGSTNFSILFPNPSSKPLGGDEVLARNVIGFTLKPYYRDAAGVAQPTNGTLTNQLAYLDASLSVINYATAAQLGNSSGTSDNWNTNTAPQRMKDLIEKNEQDFYIRIPVEP